jgi:hypothetical protein
MSGARCLVSGKKSEVRSPKSEVGMTKHGVQSHISRNVHDAVILDSVS